MSAKSQTFEFEKQVREACKHYNKPERIGKLPIASVALQATLLEDPTHPTDLVGRGKALQSVIKENLLKLEPKEKHSREWEIYLCLSCYIFQRAYSKNIILKNVQIYIEANHQIPKATYNYRLKKEGIPELSYLISTYLSQKLTWIEPIPQIVNFIGRENKLDYYHKQLEQNKIAVIEGIGGIGKTALAAQLATSIKNEDQRAVCWVTLRAGLNDSPMALLYGWAVFLAQHDSPQLWAFMRATATEEKRLPEYYPILRQGLAQVKPLLCIDNLELLSEGQDGFWGLLSIVQQDNVSLLLISQQRPLLSNLDDYDLLSGLSRNKVRTFLAEREVELTDNQLDRVVNYTNGNLRLLDLWTAYVKQQVFDVPTSLERLLNSAAAGAFLTNEVINALTKGQKQAARLLAFTRLPLDSFILQEPPRHLSPLSDFDIEDDDFERLQRLGLIQQQSGKQWSISLLLKEYLINSSIMDDTDEINDLHEWLANLYLSQSNMIESAYHLIKADEGEQAVSLLAKQKQTLIEQGQASALSSILNMIAVEDLSVSTQEVLRYLRMELGLLLGNYKGVKENALAAEKEAKTYITKAHAKQIQGEVEKRQGHLQSAIEFYKDALSVLIPQRVTLEAWLHRDLAWVLLEKNDFDEAWIEAQRSQIALNNTLGTIAQRRGDWTSALNHYEKALQIGEEYEEHRLLMKVRNNIAIHYIEKNHIKKAITLYKRNLQTIEEIGELVGKAITNLNLGHCYRLLNQFRAAIEYTTKSLSIFKDLGDARGQMFANQNLAEQYRQINELDKAQAYINQITKVDPDLKKTREYAEGLRIYAEILLAQKELSSALEHGEQGLNILREPNTVDKFTDPFYAKQACETLARIHSALGNTAEAEKYEALAKVLADILKLKK